MKAKSVLHFPEKKLLASNFMVRTPEKNPKISVCLAKRADKTLTHHTQGSKNKKAIKKSSKNLNQQAANKKNCNFFFIFCHPVIQTNFWVKH